MSAELFALLVRFRILLNCCGIMDVLTFEQAQMNLMGAIHHYQVF